MTLWVCAECSTAYAVGCSACPQCHSVDFFEEGDMPKITKARGVTYEPVAVERPTVAPAPESVPAASDPASRSADTPAAPIVPQRPAQPVVSQASAASAGRPPAGVAPAPRYARD